MKLYKRADGTVIANEEAGAELLLELGYANGPHPNEVGIQVIGDQITVDCYSPDTGPVYVNINSVPSVGSKVGFDWVVDFPDGGHGAVSLRYTVLAGDNQQKIVSGLANVLRNDPTVTQAMQETNFQLAIDERPNQLVFNVPWLGVTTFNPVGTGVSIDYKPSLDNNPYIGLGRNIPGRMPLVGDQLGGYRSDGQNTADGGITTQYMKIQPVIDDLTDPDNPIGAVYVGTCNEKSRRAAYPVVWYGRGAVMPGQDGSGNKYMAWPGHGNFGVYGLVFQPCTPPVIRNNMMWVNQQGQLMIRLNGVNKRIA